MNKRCLPINVKDQVGKSLASKAYMPSKNYANNPITWKPDRLKMSKEMEIFIENGALTCPHD